MKRFMLVAVFILTELVVISSSQSAVVNAAAEKVYAVAEDAVRAFDSFIVGDGADYNKIWRKK